MSNVGVTGEKGLEHWSQTHSDPTSLSIRRKRSVSSVPNGSSECDENFVSDATVDFCFAILNTAGAVVFNEASNVCDQVDADLLSFDNNQQVDSFINLANQGKSQFLYD